jgi:hypothetical protein
MSFHWVYDQATIASKVGNGSPEFFVPPQDAYYTYPLGWGTPYGQQTLMYLQLGAATGGFDPAALEAAYYATYRAGGPAR